MVSLFLTQYVYKPCYWFVERPGRHPEFSLPPRMVVLHCGWRRADLCGYMERPFTDSTDKYATRGRDGKWRRQVSIHFAWDPGQNDFVQMLPLNRTAWHVGSVKWAPAEAFVDRGYVQAVSYGIEGPGPWDRDRDDVEMGAWIRLLTALHVNDPGLSLVVGHQSLTPGRLDPGPGFKWHLIENLGYIVTRP